MYQIHTYTYIPSVFGGTNTLIFQGDNPEHFIIGEQTNWFRAIRNEINLRLVGSGGYKLAVVVFFESFKVLKEFFESRELADIKETVLTMTERTSPNEREGLVRQAASTGSVSLLTREYGRGSDFKCYDDELLLNGGVHVIQTFFSDLVSEETQIQGRTARQGDKGSYSLSVHIDQSLPPTAAPPSRLLPGCRTASCCWAWPVLTDPLACTASSLPTMPAVSACA
eukprot:SAG22_NODE_363_length_11694_cov_40.815783_18_plen_225_part_00